MTHICGSERKNITEKIAVPIHHNNTTAAMAQVHVLIRDAGGKITRVPCGTEESWRWLTVRDFMEMHLIPTLFFEKLSLE